MNRILKECIVSVTNAMRFRLVPKVIPDPVHLGLPLRGYLAQGVPEPVLADKEGPLVRFAHTFSSYFRIA